MDSSAQYTEKQAAPQKKIATEFGSWPVNDAGADAINEVKGAFDQLLGTVSNRIPPHNGRYLALVKTKLEEACMFAVKGISLPQGN